MSRYFIFATIAVSLLLYSSSMSSVSVAFMDITTEFDSSLVIAGWVMSIFQLASTIAMPLAGKAGDMFGSKLTFMIATLLFTVASFLSAIAPNIYLLILFRFLQAIGGGCFLPIASGIVADIFPKARQRAIGLFSSILPVGQLLGPNVGGWMTETYGWRSLFWVYIPFGIVVLVAMAFLLAPGQKKEGHMDMTGAGLFAGSLFAFMGGLTGIKSLGSSSWVLCGVFILVGVVFVIAFVRHEKRAKNPILDLEVLRDRPFVAANIYNFGIGAVTFGALSFVPLYAVSIYGMSTLQSGLILTPRAVGMAITSIIASMYIMRWGYRRPILIGTIFMIIALVLMGFELTSVDLMGIHLGSTALLLLIMLLIGVGSGLAIPAANNACMELMPQRIATITGVRGMFRQTGGAITIAAYSIVLEFSPQMSTGFAITMIGMGIAVLLTVPMIYMMPSGPDATPYQIKASSVRKTA
ncbi:MAG: MFS transporter [Dehalococcoidales bacterium]|nr:MFS transporter [Dehalococcoidales bacterium]